ncbi:hypothetical protein H2248_012621 [Termitomyces sp. 'cryptogamus']|nr:hypothetical protein H2248_012621 [Termitomyces sp. 'cryptogamus']
MASSLAGPLAFLFSSSDLTTRYHPGSLSAAETHPLPFLGMPQVLWLKLSIAEQRSFRIQRRERGNHSTSSHTSSLASFLYGCRCEQQFCLQCSCKYPDSFPLFHPRMSYIGLVPSFQVFDKIHYV